MRPPYLLLFSALLVTSFVAQAATETLGASPSADTAASAPKRPSKCEKPSYPLEARKAGHQGTTKLRFTVDAEGLVVAVEVRASSGSDLLDQAAIEALSGCTFKPSVEAGVPRTTKSNVEYVWKLD